MRPPVGSSMFVASVLVGLISTGCSRCSRDLQEKALHEHALEMCTTTPHRSGKSCAAAVERELARCSPPFLDKRISAEEFATCLGFVMGHDTSVSPAVLGGCDAPNVSARISVSLAKSAPWEGGASREVEGRTLYVAKVPTVSTSDVRALRLEEGASGRVVAVELSEEAAKRLQAITGDNVGESMILALNDAVIAPKIASAIPGPKLVIAAQDARLEDLCKVP